MQNDNKDHYGKEGHNEEKLNDAGNKEPMNNDKPYSTGSLDSKKDGGYEEPKSKTYNEDDETWKKEKEERNTGPNSDPGLTSGTKNNNWDANDPTQRTNGLHKE